MLRREDFEEGEARRTKASMGLIVVLVLAIAGIVLVRELRRQTNIEDCIMSGRSNCLPIEVPQRRYD
jgi:hypothetical protein